MILVISSFADEHARAVLNELSALEAQATLLDLSHFPVSSLLSLRFQETRQAFKLQLANADVIDFAECQSIWWRRPQPLRISDAITSDRHRLFAHSEAQEAITGLWQALDAQWINQPIKDLAAHHKVFQLRVAQDVGLRIPDTLITNHPTEARAFIDVRGPHKTIFKSFSATAEDWRETRVLTADELEHLDAVALAPVIFQEYVEAAYDLRITVIASQVFPAAIYSQDTSYKADFRMDIANAKIAAVGIPASVKSLLLKYMRRLGLTYGAIDMRVTPDGDYLFLEVNPAGQWLFIEQKTKQPITRELAKELVCRDRGSRGV